MEMVKNAQSILQFRKRIPDTTHATARTDWELEDDTSAEIFQQQPYESLSSQQPFESCWRHNNSHSAVWEISIDISNNSHLHLQPQFGHPHSVVSGHEEHVIEAPQYNEWTMFGYMKLKNNNSNAIKLPESRKHLYSSITNYPKCIFIYSY